MYLDCSLALFEKHLSAYISSLLLVCVCVFNGVCVCLGELFRCVLFLFHLVNS